MFSKTMSQVNTKYYIRVVIFFIRSLCYTKKHSPPFYPGLAIKYNSNQVQSTNLKFTTYSSAIIDYQQLLNHERETKSYYNSTDVVFHLNNKKSFI